jgi:hypothetical protein
MDFETAAVTVKEDRIRLFRRECMLASVAVANNAAAWLAHLWGSDVSTQQINRRALAWDTFPLENILPDISLALYGAALDAARKEDGTEDGVLSPALALAWLEKAIEEKWSPRELRDAADILKGKHLSSTAFRGRAQVTRWVVATGALAVEGLPLSGAAPEVIDIVVREVLG